jgi:small subunit ribosomal protein S7
LPKLQTFEHIKRIQLGKEGAEANPYLLLHRAVQNVRPFLQTVPVKRGGHTYQVPVPIRENASLALAVKWLVEAGKEKDDDVKFYFRMAHEIVEASEGKV